MCAIQSVEERFNCLCGDEWEILKWNGGDTKEKILRFSWKRKKMRTY